MDYREINVVAMKVFSSLCITSGVMSTGSQVIGTMFSGFLIGTFGSTVYVATGILGFAATFTRRKYPLLATVVLSSISLVISILDPVLSNVQVKSNWTKEGPNWAYNTTVVYFIMGCSILAFASAFSLIMLTSKALGLSIGAMHSNYNWDPVCSHENVGVRRNDPTREQWTKMEHPRYKKEQIRLKTNSRHKKKTMWTAINNLN